MRIALVSDCYWPRVNGVTVSVQTYRDELIRQGHDVIVVPLYLPLSSEDASAKSKPAFYSAVALYLRHTCPVLDRALPASFWRMLDSMAVLRFAAHRAGSTRASLNTIKSPCSNNRGRSLTCRWAIERSLRR